MTMTDIEISRISYKQNRQDVGDISTLAENIKTYGLRTPILVRDIGDDKYEIIDGRRRFEAVKILGAINIACLVMSRDEKRTEEIALITNTHRLNLSPVELWQQAVQYVKGDLKLAIDPAALPPDKIKAVAEKLNLDINATCRILNIGRLDVAVRDLIAENKLPLRLALMTLNIPDVKVKNAFCRMCVNEKPSIRGALEWIRHQSFGGKNEIFRDLDRAVFDTAECKACRHRGITDASLFEDTSIKDHKDWCWNLPCYDKKCDATWQRFM